MINVSIAGIGGQGSVLAARILAQAAEAKGWQVRSAETIGMAQRGGNVMSHVRMGNDGEKVSAPLPAHHSVDVLIALEPGEGARALPFLKPDGLLVVAQTGIGSTTLDFKGPQYQPALLIDEMRAKGIKMAVVDDFELCTRLGSRKALNIVMLAAALRSVDERDDCRDNALRGELGLDEMRRAIPLCVKERFVDMNLKAVDLVQRSAKV